MNPMASIEALQGTPLLATMCALLFLEECGLPIPFAPGDLVLALIGIAIAGGRLNAGVAVIAVWIACVCGAMIGRELFALLGWDRLMRLADRIHARRPLERAAAMLRRNGWRAVFTARLIPGLRVHTTEVAGVIGMSRRSFFAGLTTATTVYVAAFVGLGAAVGRPILALIHAGERQALLVAVALVVLVVLILLLRSRVERMMIALVEGGWTGLRVRIDSPRVIVIAACIGLNFAGHALVVGFKLPLFLDSVGTVLCGVIAGPWVGGSVGFISNLITSNTIDPIAAPYSVVSFALGFVAGLYGMLRWRGLTGYIGLALTCFATAVVLSTPLNLLFFDGKTGVAAGDSLLTTVRSSLHLPLVTAATVAEAAIDLPDKLLTVGAALLIAEGLPRAAGPARQVEVDLGQAFAFPFRSRRWRRRLAWSALCLLLAWLVVPLLLLTGYGIAVAREVRNGHPQLPPPGRWRPLLKDGFLMVAIVFIWELPSVAVPQPARAISDVWDLLVILAMPAIVSQYLRGGFKATFNVRALIRRLQFNLGLTILVGALEFSLIFVGLIGLAGLVVGVLLTLPYASLVGAYLSGTYARLTEPPRSDQPEVVLRSSISQA